MSSNWGNQLKLSIFGESHGNGIGVVLDGLPAGIPIDQEEILAQMARRAPGRDLSSTPRKEEDLPEILSGVRNGTLTGAPLAAVIRNRNVRSGDYGNLSVLPRPGHADYTGYIRYQGANDIRGGGHFSGRLTAPLVFAGAVCRQVLERRGIKIAAHIARIASVTDDSFPALDIPGDLMARLSRSSFAVIRARAEDDMRAEIERARLDCDSVGGVVECAVTGVPAGAGSPMFGGVENVFSSILFGIPAVKAVEFGDGFACCGRRGSENNDSFYYNESRQVKTRTNHCGGILGGITNGMPILFRVGIKPTASIGKEQDTIDLSRQENAKLVVKGRHDPCIVPRAVPVVEAAAAAAPLDLLLERGSL